MAQQTSDSLSRAPNQAQHANDQSDDVVALLGGASRYIMLLTAWVAMSGSLFFSEALGWVPCVLCWYQRILMYPLALLIAIGMLRRDNGLHVYILPLSLMGASVSLYHYLLVKTDWLPPPPCTAGVSCTVDYLNWFGFVNIPFLALMAFLIISFMAVATTLQPFDDAPVTDTVETPHGYARRSFSRPNVAVFALIGLVVGAFVVAARLI